MNKSFIDRIEFIWKSFCDLHQKLYMITCEEYQMLIGGDTAGLGKKVEAKISIIEDVKDFESNRQKLIIDINATIQDEDKKINNISDLLSYYKESEILRKYHKILLNEIKKIQEQGKKNRLFINRAMGNLRNIRQEITGKNKKITTYNDKGFVSGQGKFAGL